LRRFAFSSACHVRVSHTLAQNPGKNAELMKGFQLIAKTAMGLVASAKVLQYMISRLPLSKS
jgi:hypothetical protein